MVCSVDPCFSVCSSECGFLVKAAKPVQAFSALFYFHTWKRFSKCPFLFCLPSPPLFLCCRGTDCNRRGFSGSFFSLVTSAVSPRLQRLRQSGWYGEEMLKLELELDQAAGELLDPALLPEKCLCNYTINVVFMLMLY